MKQNANPAPVRTLVIDQHAIVRFGLKHLLSSEPGFQLCGEAASPDEAFRMVEETSPGLVILEFAVAGGAGLDFVERLSDAYPDLPMLVFSSEEEMLYAERLLRAGARGYVSKQASLPSLLDAIRRVTAGQLVVGDQVKEILVERAAGRPTGRTASPMARLTAREAEVFILLGEGNSTREVAEKLDVSIKTVETHRAKIMRKLDLDGASRLIHSAVSWVRFERPGGDPDPLGSSSD